MNIFSKRLRVPLIFSIAFLVVNPITSYNTAKSITPSPVMGIYIDAPFVQGSYADSATSTTVDFNSISTPDSVTARVCDNPLVLNSEITLNYKCSIFNANQGGIAYSASTTSSEPTVGGSPSQFISSYWPGRTYESYLFTFAHPQKYVGFWWAAGSEGNSVEFYNGSTLVTTLNVDQIMTKIGSFPADFASDTHTIQSLAGSTYLTKKYFGNPQGYSSLEPVAPTANDYLPAEPFVYVHAFAGTGISFTQVQFNGTGFEADNLTISQSDVTINNRLSKVQNLYAAGGSTVYNLTFNSNGGSLVNDIDFLSGDTVTLPSAPTRAGYDFLNWRDSATVNRNAGETYSPTSANNNYQAIWRAKTLNVTYDSQGGSAVAGETTTVGMSINTSPATPTRSNFTFHGWYENSSGGSPITFPFRHNKTSDFTLYAHWSAISSSYSGGSPTLPPPKIQPTLNWSDPSLIDGDRFSESKLKFEFSVPGKVSFSIPTGTILNAGSINLEINFVPDDVNRYLEINTSKLLIVSPKKLEVINTQTQYQANEIIELLRIYFNNNEYFLDAIDRKQLKNLANQIFENNYNSIVVYGNTDIKKGVDNNWLSKMRAQAVANYLIGLNVKAKFDVSWFGPNRPVTTQIDVASLALNRRVEIYSKK